MKLNLPDPEMLRMFPSVSQRAFLSSLEPHNPHEAIFFADGNPEVWGWGTCDLPTVTLLSPGRDRIEAGKTQLPGSWTGKF